VAFTGGHDALGPTFSFRYVKTTTSGSKQVPTVSQVGPSGGPVAGGNTVLIQGSGFTGATRVAFGGVPAASFSVINDSMIRAVAPPEGSASCLSVSHTSASGLCQTQVVVTSSGQASPTVPILKPMTGNLNYDDFGNLLPGSSCGCEVFPTITEYDFQVAPTLTGLRNYYSSKSAPLFTPGFGGIALLTGTGFNILTFEYLTVGDPSLADNRMLGPYKISSTSMLMNVPPAAMPSPTGSSSPAQVVSFGGLSQSRNVAYGALPKVSSVSSKLLPSAGGLALTISGAGFTKVSEIDFVPVAGAVPFTSVLRNFTVVNSTTITMPTPSLVPGGYVIIVAGQYGSSGEYIASPIVAPGPGEVSLSANEVVVAYPGQPAVTAGTGPVSCPVSGGCSITISGYNFGYPTNPTVYVGDQVASITSFTETAGVDSITLSVPASPLSLQGLVPVMVVTPAGTSPIVIEASVFYQ
jgi:uncharacterized Zn-binding protein involved in type VI secretion